MKRLTILILGAGLMASACGSRGAASLGPVPSGSPPRGSPSASPSPDPGTPTTPPTATTPPGSGQVVTFEVWLIRGGKLFVTERTDPFTPAVGQLSLDSLIEGPAAQERDAQVTTAIPAGVESDITDLANGIATVDLSGAFFQSEAATVRQRQAQVVYTLTQYDTIDKVTFTSPSLGVDTGSRSWARGDFEDLLPAILVESPLIGQHVANPVIISGTANVFEATVSIRILDRNGDEVARTFTTATCGTGCRGDYSVSVSYDVGSEQPGTIEVFESSAADGSMINVQSIPVTLSP
jgi:hypothetical protein